MVRKLEMEAKRFKGLLLSALITATLLALAVSFSPANRASAAPNGFTPHNPIYIVGNVGFTAANGVVAGSGTEDDPYIIENWDISSTSAHGIRIHDTTAYFVIRNCYVHDEVKVVGYIGITLYNVVNGKIDNNIINSYYGISLSSSKNIIISNNIANTYQNISLGDSNNNIISNNLLSNAGTNIYLYHSKNNLVSNNLVENGYSNGIFLYDSDNNLILNNLVENNERGIYFQLSDNNLISNNIVKNNTYGISLGYLSYYYCSNNIVENNLVENNERGICLFYSGNNLISNNIVKNNSYGIFIVSFDDITDIPSNNLISNNLVRNGYCGIFLSCSDNNLISNNLVENNEKGIYIELSDNNLISNNIVKNNTYGISIGYSGFYYRSYYSSNNIISNNLVENNNYGILTYSIDDFWYVSSNNLIYHNNFVNNENQAYDEGSDYWDDGYPSGGNYWSDYIGTDNYRGENQDLPGSDGIGDTPYYISGDSNRDRYPLMSSIGPVVDTTPPTSIINPIEPYWQIEVPFTVSATASDDMSGVASVELWYRYSLDNWTDDVAWKKRNWQLYGVDTNGADGWSWSFDAPYGYCEFYSIATDLACNREEIPIEADARCRFAKYLVDIAVIYAEPRDREHFFDRAHYERIAENVRKYYDEVSYGVLALNFEIYDNNENWFKLPGSDDDYWERFLWWRLDSYNDQFFIDAVLTADMQINYGDFIAENYVILIVDGGDGGKAPRAGARAVPWEPWINVETAEGTVTNMAVVWQGSDVSTWAHEIAHVLGRIFSGRILPDLYKTPFLYEGGEIDGWGLMGGPVNWPVHLCSWSKERLGWLKYQDFSSFSGYVISLPNLSYNDNVLRRWTDGLFDDTYFVFEVRSSSDRYSKWDIDVPISWDHAGGLVVYQWYDPIWAAPTLNVVPNPNTGRSYFLPGESCWLKPPSILPLPMPGVRLFVHENRALEDRYEIKISVQEEWLWNNRITAQLNPFPQWWSSTLILNQPSDNTSWPDLDLHAYTPDGKHVGMNYVTGEYEIQIPGALASGDFYNSSEWISILENIEVYFIISSRDVAAFLEAQPMGVDNENGFYTLTIWYFDENMIGSGSYAENQITRPGAEAFHRFQIVRIDNYYSVEVSPGIPTVVRGVDVSILPSYQSGFPEEMLIYTITFTNIGIISDNYNLSVSDNSGWILSLSEDRLENVQPGENRIVTLGVVIPENAYGCTEDNITVTATGTGISDSDSCIAHATIVRGVDVSISPGYQGGLPGETLTYAVIVKNKGNVEDNFSLESVDNLGWQLELENSWLVIPPDENRMTNLRVTVPMDAEKCTEDNITVIAKLLHEPTVENRASCIAHAVTVPAAIDIKENIKRLKSRGGWVTAYIELPYGYSVENIDISTVKLVLDENEVLAEPRPTRIGDYDKDGISDIKVRFSWSTVRKFAYPGEVLIRIIGKVAGIPFEGSDVIWII